MNNFNFTELLNLLNLLIVPLFVWVIKVEKRLTHLETKFDVCFQFIQPDKLKK